MYFVDYMLGLYVRFFLVYFVDYMLGLHVRFSCVFCRLYVGITWEIFSCLFCRLHVRKSRCCCTQITRRLCGPGSPLLRRQSGKEAKFVIVFKGTLSAIHKS